MSSSRKFIKVDTTNKKVTPEYINKILNQLRIMDLGTYDDYTVFKKSVKIKYNYSIPMDKIKSIEKILNDI